MTRPLTAMRAAIVAALLLVARGAPAVAQGTLSTQGLGFPPGQLSAQARAMGGSVGETDPMSALNPAAIGLLNSAIVMMHAEPEYRVLTIDARRVNSTVSRFPLFLGAMPLGSRWAVGLAASTLLDRTWATTTRDSQVVNGDSIFSTFSSRSEGSITDVRLAVSFAPALWLKLGVAGHALSGSDLLTSIRTFDDTISFATDGQQRSIGFGGNALSAGAVALFPLRAAVGLTYRRGGSLRAYAGDEVVGSGSAPDHLGVSVVYLGIRGSALAIRAAKDSWSGLSGMAEALNIHEGWDLGAGADVTGPRFGASAIGLRAGARWRTLPFSPNDMPVKERTWSGGFVLPLGAQQNVELQMGLLRSSRTNTLPASAGGVSVAEKAWTLSTGFAVRP